jgi:hypothetical protein
MSYGTKTVTTSATLIVDANPKRQELIITNNSTAVDIYIGQDASVTTSTGLPLYANQTRERSRNGGTVGWLGPVYGICASSADIRYWESER